jgi:7,8-dihydropterin-6-yl-methyl-4-(beta-D-ribofuranosyl)aminobenzene 5'-phosphate synthase
MANLIELDSIEIIVIVDNELDPISPSPNPAVQQGGTLRDVGMNGPALTDRGGAARELRMDHICCSAHGLSLMVTGTKGDQKHTILFDTGPEEHVWERNASRLRALMGIDIGTIETIQLSHWHRDHSGGMLKVIDMINEAKKGSASAVEVDLHPARPDYRGMQPPGMPVVSLEADPTFQEIEKAGGVEEGRRCTYGAGRLLHGLGRDSTRYSL